MAVNQVQNYTRGTLLFAPGDDASAIYVVLEGTIIASKDEHQVTLGAGGIVGEVAFFKDTPHNYHAICGTDVTALTITRENVPQVVANQPRIALSLLCELAHQAASDEMIFILGVDEAELATAKLGALPENHPIFEERVPVEYNEFLFDTEVQCPICQTNFSAIRTRVSRLQLEEQKTDFRTIYRRFEPNFFYIWVCPECQFAYPERQFTGLSQKAIALGRKAWQENPPAESFIFDVQRTIHQVITSYYLAMASFEKVGASLEQWANLWLRLVWIYEDLEEEGLAIEAAEKAHAYFLEAMSTKSRSVAGDQQLYLILGELNLRLGQTREAFNNFRAASTLRGGDPRYQRTASDRIQDLREERED